MMGYVYVSNSKLMLVKSNQGFDLGFFIFSFYLETCLTIWVRRIFY